MKTQLQEAVIVTTNGHKNSPALAPSLAGDNPLWLEGLLFNFLAAGEDTQGNLALVEAIQRKGYEPLHQLHQETDVTFYVGEGEMTFYVEGAAIAAPAGSNVFIGRGQEYTFTVETASAQTLIAFTPAVTKEFFKAMSAPALR